MSLLKQKRRHKFNLQEYGINEYTIQGFLKSELDLIHIRNSKQTHVEGGSRKPFLEDMDVIYMTGLYKRGAESFM